jgi:hypothetical protein
MQDGQSVDKQSDIEITSVDDGSINVNQQKPDISVQNSMKSSCSCSCSSEGEGKMSPPSYVYAIGKVVHRFPSRSLELELVQAIGRRPEDETRGHTSEEVVHKAPIFGRYILSQTMSYQEKP